ncbi:MAG TPA: MIP/aquaporin family protein [Methanomassiliicoccaceae archaeon]|jgi:glycerol uptake facilitator-like aquaporin|nr:MIP/aquaporin family protein [Methanomassiliicoccaceae archaeon]HPT73791.1 MIP/aquaporin family protein [Methanomassiliicoccaceae archaeon]
MPSLKQNLLAEFLGTMFLVTVAIASVILPFALDGSTVVLAVFINALAVAFVLFALIETFGSVSGAHFNPAVTLALLASKEIDKRKAACYIGVQLAGGFLGMLVAHLMFLGTTSTFYPDTSTLITISSNVKLPALYFAEFIGTFLLVGVIIGCVRGGSKHTGLSVALVVGGMLVTTSSTMFANPAVTFARIFTYAICGIAPESAVFFMIAEIVGAISATYVFGIMFPSKLKEKCEPYDCKKPIVVGQGPPANGGA